MFKQMADLLGLYCLMEAGSVQDPSLLTSKNTNRRERAEIALLMFVAGFISSATAPAGCGQGC